MQQPTSPGAPLKTAKEPMSHAMVKMASGRVAQVYFAEAMDDADLWSLLAWMAQNLRVEPRAAERRARLLDPSPVPVLSS